MINDIRLLGSESAFDIFGHLDQLWEALFEDLAVAESVHELIEAPENGLLVANVEKQHGNDIVHALDITNFIVVISICFQYIEKFIISTEQVLVPQLKLTHRAIYIFLNIEAGFIIWKLA